MAVEEEHPAELIEAYYERGWTDGLPVVPPSDQSIAAMLAGASPQGGRDDRRDRGARRGSERREARHQCRHGGLPARVPARGGRRDPQPVPPAVRLPRPRQQHGRLGHGLDRQWARRRRIGMNSGNNAFGQGTRANATIGRAVRLTMMNVMNTRPGFLDRATLGNPGKYSFCFAENEVDHPWEPLHVERGCRPDQSAVTVYASNSLCPVYNQLAATPEPLLRCFADALCHLGTPNLRGFNQSLVVFAGEHADVLRPSRWSKRDVRGFLMEHARRTIADLKRAAAAPARSSPPTSTRTSTPSSAPRTFSSSARAARPEAGRPACPAGATSGPGASPPSSTSREDRTMKLFDPTSTRASAPSPGAAAARPRRPARGPRREHQVQLRRHPEKARGGARPRVTA